MYTPSAKRQRLNAASLSKPFRSPVKALSPDSEPKDSETPTFKRSLLPNEQSLSKQSKQQQVPTSHTTPLPRKQTKTAFYSPAVTAALNSDPDIAPLIKSQRQLEKQLRELKDELDEARQARKIEGDSKKKDPDGEVDGELKALRQKWKEASRLAAEDLFTGVRDRVNRMGGPKAWKEIQDRQREFQRGYDEEPQHQAQPDSDDEGAPEVERRDLYAVFGEPETENEKEARGGNEVDEDEIDDEFTMSMMLRTLNVPLDLIGYDREQQRWVG